MSEATVKYDIGQLTDEDRTRLSGMLAANGIEAKIDGDCLAVPRSDEARADTLIEQHRRSLAALQIAASMNTAGRVLGGVRCELCSSTPAARLTLRRQVGMIVVGTTYTINALLCDTCGDVATRDFQKQTAIKGWTGLRSAVMNPVIIATNARNRQKHRNALKGM